MWGILVHVQLTTKDKGIYDACARAKSTRHRFKSKLPDRTKIIQSTNKPTRKEEFSVKSDDIADSEGEGDSDSEGGEKKTLVTSVAKVLTQTKPLRTIIPKLCTDIKCSFSAHFSQHKSDTMAHVDYH